LSELSSPCPKEDFDAQARDPHTVEFAALQDRWRCKAHRGRFCYKLHAEAKATDHAELDTTALSDWAAAIVNETSSPEWMTSYFGPGSFETPLPWL
jgi:hypothetical protein